jgi:TldD protein
MNPVFRYLDEAVAAALSSAAIDAATAAGATLASCRVEAIRNQVVVVRDGDLETSQDNQEFGLGVRVLVGGALGFAATVALTVDDARAVALQAVQVARSVARAQRQVTELAPEPSYGLVRWASPYEIDPTTVPLAEKVDLLGAWSQQLLASPHVQHVTAYVLAVTEEKHYADSVGTTAFQQRVRVNPEVEAVAVDDAGFESMSTTAPPVGRGWEYLLGTGWDFASELAQLPEWLAEKKSAPSVTAGRYDVVIDPTNLWLTIHESIGHATELDRALGYEAAYAGTSFATPDKRGSLVYGSPIMNVTGDRTAQHGLASVAIDDEGVAAQSFPLIENGILTGYQLDRATASVAGYERSNGCAFADSPLHVPLQRMANVSLAPAPGDGPSTDDLISDVEHGLYIVGDKSWSIDMQRYNFQFTGQRFFRIENGHLAGQVKDVAYQATTTEFWGGLEKLGGEQTYLLAGAFNCGKAQPGQVAAVSHGCPSVLMSQVNILNTRSEAGR